MSAHHRGRGKCMLFIGERGKCLCFIDGGEKCLFVGGRVKLIGFH